MAGFLQSILGSTIAARLATLLLLPLTGLALFGAFAANQEREAILIARELRQDAQLVELLSSIAVAIDIEADSLVGYREAGSVGMDAATVSAIVGRSITEDDSIELDLDSLFDSVAAQDRRLWAEPHAVEEMLANRQAFDGFRRDPAAFRPGLDETTRALSTASTAALAAQSQQLNQLFGHIELGTELTATAQSMHSSRSLLEAAQAERRALAEYVLPIGGRSVEENYQSLIAANARYELRLADLEDRIPDHHRDRLDDITRSESWVAFAELRDQAVNRDIDPITSYTDPFTLLPAGIVTFVHGFERTAMLLDLDRRLSAEFTAGALRRESAANDRMVRALLIGVAMSIATILTSYLTIRSITRPVMALLDRARRITGGDLHTRRPLGGPTDISMVHTALDEMSANLRTLSDQTEALSAGRLEDEVLSRTVVGPLGDSVHGSVARLRSMTSRLEYEATHDALTGLPNRAAVLSLLDRCLTGAEADRTPLAAVMLDLDGFKQANDNMGHPVGDEVLVHVAERLRRQAQGEFVARLGGDEFMIVVTGPDACSRAIPMARAAIAAVRSPAAVSCGTINVSASAGVVETTGPDWLSPSEVLQRVDLAMYEAKSDTPGEVVLFDQRLHDSLLETTKLQGELRRALGVDEFDIHLQPIVSIADNEITGYEALIRWESATRGRISPALFIPVAEQSELITHIDSWIIERTSELLAQWQQDPTTDHLTLSINISAKHLSRPDLADKIEAAIDRYQLTANRYVVEITESQLIPNLSRAENTLRRLRDLGVKLAIDDFGTGYASVAHLRRVAFDRLKIDRSFLAHLDDETDRSLATLLVSLGRDLQLEVVAEGIETEAQLDWAASAGCTHAQGYLLGRPGPIVGSMPPVGSLGPATDRSTPLG